jgi:hypothetical protein
LDIPIEKIKEIKQYLASEDQIEEYNLSFDNLNEKQQESEMDATRNYVFAIKGRVIDIYKIYHKAQALTILREKAKAKFVSDLELATKVGDGLEIAFMNLKHWWDGNVTSSNPEDYDEPFFEVPQIDNNIHSNGDNATYETWDPRHLEYGFKLQIISGSNEDGGNGLIFDASEYKEDHLDWYSFTLEKEILGQQQPPTSQPKMIALTSNHLKFAGMPEKRWWNFEDSYVDFGSTEPKKNNIASTLLMEFALVHSSDWYVIPYQMKLGTVSKIENLTVIDSFGDTTIIEPAGFTAREQNMLDNIESWNSWNMFSISKKSNDQLTENTRYNTSYFFLPPSDEYIISGSTLEEIKFLRDETANLAWAVEKTYRTLYGEPVSGYEHYLSKNKNEEIVNDGNIISNASSSKPVKYTLMTTVPWNWIPFIPIHTNKFLPESMTNLPSYSHIKLQRGAMIDPETKKVIRPNSRLLDNVQPRYYIDESEIPRSGIVVSEKYQRTVWHNGRVFLWIGRKKFTGTGEGSSGLTFDSIPLERQL